MKFCNLASGSKGNCSVISTKKTTILIDDGISFKELKKRCELSQIDVASIKAIFITHEHDDHIAGIKSLVKNLEIPVYVHPKQVKALCKKIGDSLPLVVNDYTKPVLFEDIEINAFNVSHDALYTQGFVISSEEKKIVMATDLGFVSDNIYSKLLQGDYIYLESNFDRQMLLEGPYHYCLKTRIAGNKGHLSNDDSAKTVVSLVKEGKNRFMLAHISETNNTEEQVLNTLYKALDEASINRNLLDIKIARQYCSSGVIEI